MSAYSSMAKISHTKKIVLISILSAVAFIIMLLQFPLPITPSFYKLDISDVIILIGGFILGPMSAVIMEAGKIILNILIHGSDTMFIGEIANFIMGCSLILPILLLYKKEAKMKNLLFASLIGIISLTIVGALTNYFVLLPLYANVYQMPLDAMVEMGQVLNANVKDLFSFVIFMTIPFNLIKGALVTIVTLALYKRIIPIVHIKFAARKGN